jgi:hypothetical protein
VTQTGPLAVARLMAASYLTAKDLWRFTFYVNADVTFPGQAFDDVGVSLQPFSWSVCY